jgi:hypothetical protein
MAMTLRITKPTHAPARFSLRPNGDSVTEYLARVAKTIPGEVVGLYLAGKPMLVPPAGIWALTCRPLVLLARIWATRDTASGKGPQWKAVGVSLVSYVVWIYATGDQIWFVAPPNPKLIMGAMLIWSFVIPYIWKGD